MKPRILIALVLCAVVGFALSHLSRPGVNGQEKAKFATAKWEYKILHGVLRGSAIAIDEEGLNKLGNDGWELFWVVEEGSGCLLKRQKP
jgi:hypothetical protein